MMPRSGAAGPVDGTIVPGSLRRASPGKNGQNKKKKDERGAGDRPPTFFFLFFFFVFCLFLFLVFSPAGS
jgi:hypothetical protein